MSELENIAKHMIAKGKGILAADESTGTMTKRLSSVNVESTSETRLKFRETLFSAEGMKNHIGGVILYDNNRKSVAAKIDKQGAPYAESIDFQDLLEKSVDGEGVSEFRTSSQGNYLAVAKPLTEKVSGQVSIWGYILTLTSIPGSTQYKIQTIQNTFENYKRQKFFQLPVSASYYITVDWRYKII